MKALKGTGVAMVTPFRPNGSVDFTALTKLTNHLVKGKVDYLVVMGTTGESATLSTDEKNAVLDCVVEANNGALPVVLGVGGNNTAAVCQQLIEMDNDGISAILSVSPYYNKPTQKGIFEHYKAVAGANGLPIIVYNVPGRTGSNISAETTLKLAHEVTGIIAVKEASGDLDQVMSIIKDRPKNFLVISGDDTLSLPMIAAGADGVISVVANAYPKQYSKLIANSLEGDFAKARKIQFQLLDLIGMLFEEGNPAGVKHVLSQLEVCGPKVRLPLVGLSRSLANRLNEEMAKIR
ncbi:MAG: 4-hydroxy-tetrahydrodipicolinate synthase [Flavobacteriales bacterium]|jgi:4-hydroxy-tetrahydrodipicolinate synthase